MKGRSKAVRVVYPAIFGALALVLLYLGTMVPTGTWGIAAVAGIMPVFAVLSSGLASGFLCWAGVTLLAFLLLPDKFLALLFGALFGLYPVLKGVIERLRKLPMEYLLKLAFFQCQFDGDFSDHESLGAGVPAHGAKCGMDTLLGGQCGISGL